MEDSKKNILLGVVLLVVWWCGSVFANEIAPPKYKLIDRNGVNLATGQLGITLADVSIGGASGLNHTISTYTNNFTNTSSQSLSVGLITGYSDNYRGGIDYVVHTKAEGSSIPEDLYVLRLFAPGVGADFIINDDGSYTALANIDSAGSKNKIYDEQLLLEDGPDDTYIFTAQDGTVVRFEKYGQHSDKPPLGDLLDIQYPNGLTLTIHKKNVGMAEPIMSVTNNMGWQLKYVYLDTNNSDSIRRNWNNYHPKYIKALNRAEEYCEELLFGSECSVTRNWPMASYDWPYDLMRPMPQGNSIFKVTNALGQVTEYHHKVYEIELGERFVPRLVKVKSAASDVVDMNYEYSNKGQWVIQNQFNYMYNHKEHAGLDKAWVGSEEWEYQVNMPNQHTWYTGTYSQGPLGSGYVKTLNSSKVPIYINPPGTNLLIEREFGYSNKVTQTSYLDGSRVTKYFYDGRSNIVKVTQDGITIAEANYLTSCTAANRKYCNKAVWVSDALGNKTHYTYKPSTGQVLTETKAANKNGLKAQTRYGYTAYRAKIKNSSQTLVESPVAISLLSSESICENSNYSNGACELNDEVVIQYEYDHPNLLMTRKTVVSGGKSIHWCFSYDIYGNKIGEIDAGADISSCDI